MLVKQKMTKKPIITSADISVSDALSLMHEKKVHRLPVLNAAGKLVGIVTEGDLLYASPSPATTLNVWEMHALLAKLKVDKVMTRKVITVDEETPVEEAALVMVQNNIGGLPVLRDKELVGIITESDIFKVFISLFGGLRTGIRVSAVISGDKGTFAKVSGVITQAGGDIVGLGFDKVSEGTDCSWEMTMKVQDLTKKKVVDALTPVVCKVLDVRKV